MSVRRRPAARCVVLSALAGAVCSVSCLSYVHVPREYAEVEIHVDGFDAKPGPLCVYLPRLPGSELTYDAQVADVIHAHAVATPKGVDVTLSGFDDTAGREIDLNYRTLTAFYMNTVPVSTATGAEYDVSFSSPCDPSLDPTAGE